MSTASYFRDEAGVHLSLHLTSDEYRDLKSGLRSVFAHDLWQLIEQAERHERQKDTGPGGARDIMARFSDSPPKDGV